LHAIAGDIKFLEEFCYEYISTDIFILNATRVVSLPRMYLVANNFNEQLRGFKFHRPMTTNERMCMVSGSKDGVKVHKNRTVDENGMRKCHDCGGGGAQVETRKKSAP